MWKLIENDNRKISYMWISMPMENLPSPTNPIVEGWMEVETVDGKIRTWRRTYLPSPTNYYPCPQCGGENSTTESVCANCLAAG